MIQFEFYYEKYKNVYEVFNGSGRNVSDAHKASKCPYKITTLAGIFKVPPTLTK